MTCRYCGKTDHAGGCDLVDFYFYQRFARPNVDPPSPPSPLIESSTPGVDVGTPLSVGIDISPTLSPQSENPLSPVVMRVDVPKPQVRHDRPLTPREKAKKRNAYQREYYARKKAKLANV